MKLAKNSKKKKQEINYNKLNHNKSARNGTRMLERWNENEMPKGDGEVRAKGVHLVAAWGDAKWPPTGFTAV